MLPAAETLRCTGLGAGFQFLRCLRRTTKGLSLETARAVVSLQPHTGWPRLDPACTRYCPVHAGME